MDRPIINYLENSITCQIMVSRSIKKARVTVHGLTEKLSERDWASALEKFPGFGKKNSQTPDLT
jgi:hypothetical protein